MEPLHIVTDKKNIASRVLLPGDPLRAKYIADNYLEDAVLVNDVRNMLGYTGTYKGKKVTVIGSGIGTISAALYTYELFNFYNVNKIIRLGTAGALDKDMHVGDIVLGLHSYSHTNVGYALTKSKSNKVSSSNNLNQIIINKSNLLNIPIQKGWFYTTIVFDPYTPIDHLLKTVPSNIKLLASEMESFAVFTVAKMFNKDASALVTISDNKFDVESTMSVEDRQLSLNRMIYLALESIIK